MCQADCSHILVRTPHTDACTRTSPDPQVPLAPIYPTCYDPGAPSGKPRLVLEVGGWRAPGWTQTHRNIFRHDMLQPRMGSFVGHRMVASRARALELLEAIRRADALVGGRDSIRGRAGPAAGGGDGEGRAAMGEVRLRGGDSSGGMGMGAVPMARASGGMAAVEVASEGAVGGGRLAGIDPARAARLLQQKHEGQEEEGSMDSEGVDETWDEEEGSMDSEGVDETWDEEEGADERQVGAEQEGGEGEGEVEFAADGEDYGEEYEYEEGFEEEEEEEDRQNEDVELSREFGGGGSSSSGEKHQEKEKEKKRMAVVKGTVPRATAALLAEAVAEGRQVPWYEKVIALIDPDHVYAGFSEYATFGSWMKARHGREIWIKPRVTWQRDLEWVSAALPASLACRSGRVLRTQEPMPVLWVVKLWLRSHACSASPLLLQLVPPLDPIAHVFTNRRSPPPPVTHPIPPQTMSFLPPAPLPAAAGASGNGSLLPHG
jgi:hypothetical protein